MNRRDLLLAAPALLLATDARCDLGISIPFPYGVASGDPTESSVVLWTALDPAVPERAPIRWWLRYAGERRPLREGRIETSPASDNTIKLVIDDLPPDGRFEYGFEHGQIASPIGRTITMPAVGTRTVRLAVFSCARYTSGWFHAYRHAAEDPNIDAAIHLGDYLYESGDSAIHALNQRRQIPEHELITLADYRLRHALHKKDADLQALHSAMPMMAIWDDHEFADDASRNGANTHQPQLWPQRMAAARQAYFEWMPIMAPAGQRLWRHRRIGDVADVYLLDTRIDGRDAQLDPRDARFEAEHRHMLGSQQERWLEKELARPSTAVWTVLLSSVVFSKLTWPTELSTRIAGNAPDWVRTLLGQRIARSAAGLAGNPDAWDGYPAAQRRLLRMLNARNGRTLVLSGDTHSSWAFDLRSARGEQLGWEVSVPAVTSEATLDYTGLSAAELERMFKQSNSHLNYLEPVSRGYTVVELSKDGARAEWRYVSSVKVPDATWRVGHCLDVSL